MTQPGSKPTYRVEVVKSVQKTIAKLPSNVRKMLADAMRELAIEPRPHGVTTMKGSDEREYRVKTGDWRIAYTIEDDVLLVLVVRVGPRKDAYKRR